MSDILCSRLLNRKEPFDSYFRSLETFNSCFSSILTKFTPFLPLIWLMTSQYVANAFGKCLLYFLCLLNRRELFDSYFRPLETINSWFSSIMTNFTPFLPLNDPLICPRAALIFWKGRICYVVMYII